MTNTVLVPGYSALNKDKSLFSCDFHSEGQGKDGK